APLRRCRLSVDRAGQSRKSGQVDVRRRGRSCGTVLPTQAGLTRSSVVATLPRAMTRNPNLPIAAVSDPINVALLTDDPLLRAGVSSLLAQLGSIEVVERDAAEVALWDAGVDAGKTLARLAELRNLDVPVVAVVGDSAHVAPAIAAGARGVV